MSNHYFFLLEELQPQCTTDCKSEVHFFWNEIAHSWTVTWKGIPVSGELAATLIAAAEANGMVPPESENENDEDYER